MENRGGENLPCARTFNNIFARNHLITKDASLAATHIQRFEKEKPNDMWQTDFKGNFALANGVRCHPLDPSQTPDFSPSIRDTGISCKTIFDCTVPFGLKSHFERSKFKEVNPAKWVPELFKK